MEGQLGEPSPVCGAPAGLTVTCGFAGSAAIDVVGGGVVGTVKVRAALRPSEHVNVAVYSRGAGAAEVAALGVATSAAVSPISVFFSMTDPLSLISSPRLSRENG
ncbi:hypothetical protein Amsp01_097000 [Amycolatopsis sp. NBRC 101858]|nr:hypothetical protein Amsp01_097000 [Amycolatopsis sp. NBRC 101858]